MPTQMTGSTTNNVTVAFLLAVAAVLGSLATLVTALTEPGKWLFGKFHPGSEIVTPAMQPVYINAQGTMKGYDVNACKAKVIATLTNRSASHISAPDGAEWVQGNVDGTQVMVFCHIAQATAMVITAATKESTAQDAAGTWITGIFPHD